MKRVVRTFVAVATLVVGFLSLGVGRDVPADLIEQKGCCSWHKGVCGCMGNRVQCCDGTASPTCRC